MGGPGKRVGGPGKREIDDTGLQADMYMCVQIGDLSS